MNLVVESTRQFKPAPRTAQAIRTETAKDRIFLCLRTIVCVHFALPAVMPAVPLADLGSLDLSRTLFHREDLERVLQQRGRFRAVDGILHLDHETNIVVGYKDVRSDDWWAEDHIPGRPIYPGMLMVEASAQLGTFDFFHRRPDLNVGFVGFTGIERTRFRAVVEPDCRLLLVGMEHRVRRTMFTYRFQGFVEENIVFESEVTGMMF